MTRKHWATPETVVDAIRRKWANGQLLASIHGTTNNAKRAPRGSSIDDSGDTAVPDDQVVVADTSRPLFPLRVPLPGPTRDELSNDFEGAKGWARKLQTAANTHRWELKTRNTRVPGLGTQPVPVAAVVPDSDTALALLSRAERRGAHAFAAALELLALSPLNDALRPVVLKRPHDVIAAGEDWPLLIAATEWLAANPQPGIYLRQVPIPGMHTKLIEHHRHLVTRMATAVLPPTATDPAATTFAGRFGFRTAPRHIRIRAPRHMLGLPPRSCHGDTYWAPDDLATLEPTELDLREVIVVENQTSFLVVPEHPQRAIIWGAGYQAEDLLRQLPWAIQTPTIYWGDLDTHGYSILARARRVVPNLTSVLMDVETLTAHREYCVTEHPQATQHLDNLTDSEQRVYDGLRAGTWGPNLRLEQELITYDYVQRAFMR